MRIFFIMVVIFSILIPPLNQVESYSPAVKDQLSELKVMTFNTKHGADDRLGLKGIIRFIGYEDPDIIGLQEVDQYNPRSFLNNQAKMYGKGLSMDYTFGESYKVAGLFPYGNVILSKFPILFSEVIPLPSKRGEPRSVLHAALKVGNEGIHVFNTHLSLEKEERKEQMDFLNQLVTSYDKVILMGDFNQSVVSVPNFTESKAEGASIGNGRKIDHIFASPFLKHKVSRIINTYLSDHNAIITSIDEMFYDINVGIPI